TISLTSTLRATSSLSKVRFRQVRPRRRRSRLSETFLALDRFRINWLQAVSSKSGQTVAVAGFQAALGKRECDISANSTERGLKPATTARRTISATLSFTADRCP